MRDEEFGLTIENESSESIEKNKNYFALYSPLVTVTPSKCNLLPSYKSSYKKQFKLKVYEDDVWVVNFPKAGTTWTQEMVWCLMNKLDFEKGRDTLLMRRFPFFEWDALLPVDISILPPMEDSDPCKPGVTWDILHKMPRPRTIKSHLTAELLPLEIWTKKPKIIYVSRDPMDVCVSYYFHYIKFEGFLGDFDSFVQLFLTENLLFCPYWNNVLPFWKKRNEKNILFLTFEDFKKDLQKNVRVVSDFLGISVSEEEVGQLTSHLSFSNMKNNKAVNNEAIVGIPTEKSKKVKFIRKGEVGDWKPHFTADHVTQFKKWTMDNLDGVTDFPYYQDYLNI